MSQTFIEFEQPIAELEAKINELQSLGDDHGDMNIDDELSKLREKSTKLKNYRIRKPII